MMTITELANLIRTGMGLAQVDSAQAVSQLTAPESAELDTDK